MTAIDPHTSLGELVLDDPRRMELFERLGFDYCCRGERSLADACAQRRLDVETVAEVLEAHRSSRSSSPEHEFDLRRSSTNDLCDHIVQAHHDRLRRELPALSETLATVARVHGSLEPELHDLARIFEGLRRELEEHIEHEEQVLFPACKKLESAAPADAAALLEELGDDHARVGETLLVLRDLAGGYRAEQARCGTHRALLAGLRELERDLHQHIHEENNVLFPRIRGLLAA